MWKQVGLACRHPRDYDSSDRSRGGSFNDRGPDRGDRRGYGGNLDQEERRGSFRDRGRSDYGQRLSVHVCRSIGA